MVLNPGMPPTGYSGPSTGGGGGTPLSQGPSNKFAVDYSELTGLRKEVQGLVTDITSVETALKGLVRELKASTPHLGMLGAGSSGGRGGGSGGSSSTLGTISGPAGGGGGNTVLGRMAKGLSFGAFGEVAASAAGAINTTIGRITAPGMASNLMSGQLNAAFGQSTGQAGITGTSQQLSGLSSLGQNDLVHAQATLQNNPYLWRKPGGQGSKNLNSFINSASKMNPGQGAAVSAQWANSLSSAGANRMSNILGGGQGLLVNPQGGVNPPGVVFKNLMRIFYHGRVPSPNAMKAMAQSDQDWSGIISAFGPGTSMNLPMSLMTAMRDYASTGGNLGATENLFSSTGAAHSLKKTTAQARLSQSAYQQSVPAQNRINDAKASGYNAAANAVEHNGGAVQMATYFAAAGSAALGLAGHLATLDGILMLLGGKGLLGKGGGLLGRGAASARGASVFAGSGAGAAADVAGGGAATAAGAAGGGVAAALAAPVAVAGAGLALGWWLSKDKRPLPKNWKGHGAPMGSTARGGGGNVTPKGGWASQYVGDPATGSTSTAGMTSVMKQRVGSMMAANPNLKISSGHRTSAQQSYLYAAKGGKGVARPGRSAHQSGQAADMGPPSQFGWLAKNAAKFGLGRPAPRAEPWHVQAMGDPVVSPVGAGLKMGRTDQGVDWSGKGPVFAAASGTVISTSNSGWNMGGKGDLGAFIAIKLDSPPDPQHSVIYYAEDIVPSVSVGQHVTAGQQIGMATGGPSGIELGWGDPNAIGSATGHGAKGATADGQNFLKWISGGSTGGQQPGAAAAPSSNLSATTSANTQNHAATGKPVSSTFLADVRRTWLNSGGPGSGGAPVAPITAAAPATAASPTTAAGSTTGNTTVMSGPAGNITSPSAYSKAVLSGLGIGASVTDVTNINAWQQAEGQWGASGIFQSMKMHNPLNTKLGMPGSMPIGGGATVTYPNWDEGVAAAVSTIKQSNMAGILKSLQANDNLAAFSTALEGTPWASSAYAGRSFPSPSGVYAVGDPVGAATFTPGSSRMGGVGGIRSGGVGNTFHLHMPIQMASGATQQDAQHLVQMVMAELQTQAGIDAMSAT